MGVGSVSIYPSNSHRTGGFVLNYGFFVGNEKGNNVRRLPRVSVITIIIAVVLFVVAENVPELVIGKIKPLPVNSTRVIQTKQAPTSFYDPTAECPDSATNDCHYRTEDTQFRLIISSAKADINNSRGKKIKDVAQLNISCELVLTNSKYPLLTVEDQVHLQRGSAHPILEPTSQLSLVAPNFDVHYTSELFVREGLQHYLPFNTERRSYSYFDAFAQQAFPLDYVRTEKGDENGLLPGHEVFIFEQTVPVVDIAATAYESLSENNAAARAEIAKLQLTGPAWKFYKQGGPEQIKLTPFYTAKRTLWVEPTSGTVLNQEMTLHFLFAEDQADAEKTAAEGPNPRRTLIHTSMQWDDATKAEAKSIAMPTMETMFWLRLGAFVFKYLSGVLFIYGFWVFARSRRVSTPTAT